MFMQVSNPQDYIPCTISECPSAIGQLSPTSPLFWEAGAVDALIEMAKEGIPLNLLPEPMTGSYSKLFEGKDW